MVLTLLGFFIDTHASYNSRSRHTNTFSCLRLSSLGPFDLKVSSVIFVITVNLGMVAGCFGTLFDIERSEL